MVCMMFSPSETMQGAPTVAEQTRPRSSTPDLQHASCPVKLAPPSLALQPSPAPQHVREPRSRLVGVRRFALTKILAVSKGRGGLVVRTAGERPRTETSVVNRRESHPEEEVYVPAQDPQLVGQQTSPLERIPGTPVMHTSSSVDDKAKRENLVSELRDTTLDEPVADHLLGSMIGYNTVYTHR